MSEFHRTIAAVAPSGIHNPSKLSESIRLVESWGHKVICGPNHEKRHLYTAGTLSERLSDLLWAIESPDIDLIWFIRGGYGTAQLLPHLPSFCDKPILGFSDATALLAHGWHATPEKPRWQKLYHGPVLNSLLSLCDLTSQQHVQHWLTTDQTPNITGEYAFGPNTTVSGPIVGGNLCVLASLCGGNVLGNYKGCILALEDIAEPLYKIDRMLLQLEISGMFNGVSGILLGSFHNCHPPKDADYTLMDVLKERLGHLNIPVYINSPFGHNEVNWLWQYGQIVQLGE
jgi:muramoyltetrapeptide carboxypeptidase